MKKKSILKKRTWFDYANSVFLITFAVLCIYPFVNQLLISFAELSDIYRSTVLVIPYNFNVNAYITIFKSNGILGAFLRSVYVTVVGTIYCMFLTILGSYICTRKDVPGTRIFFIMILITMFFGGGLIPFFLVVRSLGLMNNELMLGLILPFGVNAFNLIILRNFFNQVPKSVIESAQIDGAGEMTVLFKFVVPLSMAGIAIITLFYAVGKWNDWYWPMLFITNPNLTTLALELRNVISVAQDAVSGDSGELTMVAQETTKAATIIVAIVPILCVYPFLQKYFVKGLMIGGIKE